MEEVQQATESTEREDRPRFASKKPGGKPTRKKPCSYCLEKSVYIDYKDTNRLRKYVSEKGKITARRQTGICAKHQRELTAAIKRARQMSLM